LISKNMANADDRFLLARLYEVNGDWPKAKVAYRELNLRTKSSRDLETLNRRPLYLGQFINSLLRNHKAKDEEDLIEAEDLVDELKQLQPEQLSTLFFQVELARLRNQVEKASDLIQTSAQHTDLAPSTIKKLAELAEKLGRLEVAERLYRRYASVAIRDGKTELAMFLGRQNRISDALDLCESIGSNPGDAEIAAAASLNLVLSTNAPPREVDRVTSWLEQAIKQRTDSAFLLVGLGNCRERQERYDDAKVVYERVIKQASRYAASPNAKQLLATSYNNLAWLLAFKDDQSKEALLDIDNAIKLVGPKPDYLDTRGVIYLNLKKTQDAIKDLQSAVEADPSPPKLFHLAQAYLQANNRERATYYWKDAVEKKLPGGLHPLEQSAYQKVLGELGTP
jgi:cellulose synthase operon protein C